ncbi:hypothetical protein LPA44_06455 [Halobacterium sp. KA-4]|uniref:hypothetical protein n=1 Tax=Halobacterium TaxID=2239 RepID=UPI001E3952CB|nr:MULTISPECIES: hypothetical protein [Halobacterium]MCD2199536.1 hypothetical protein [Halobacterium sp. KA-4]MDL0126835.1 hypothetical protein [Halobacterium salinarum]MDL0134208.1 hypothetical protein [Halobacterium salinarum]
MSESNSDRSAEEKFVAIINVAMARAIQDDADPDVMARVCLNTARELYEHYGAGKDHSSYLTFVTDAQFEQAEIEALLDRVEGGE